jgi:hypothetical protein
MLMNRKESGRTTPRGLIEVYPSISLEGLRKTTEQQSHGVPAEIRTELLVNKSLEIF